MLLSLSFTFKGNKNISVKGSSPESSLAALLSTYEYNYTRETVIAWTAETYQEITDSNLNAFPFTSTRKTLFIENAVYMYSDTYDVNSGYYTRASTPNVMRHFRVEGGGDARDSAEGTLSKDTFSANANVNLFYVNLHTIKNSLAMFTSAFSEVTIGEKWVATNLSAEAITLKDSENQDYTIDLATAFMYFTAPTFTNPSLNENPYFSFSKAEIIYNSSDELKFQLFANETDALDNDSGLFATATITNKGTTTIRVLDEFINL